MKKILLIDNYDSFTFNLQHYLEALDCEVTVWRNDEFETTEADPFDGIIISPGPGIPDEAGNIKAIIEKYHQSKSILGICLGMQAICEVFGGKLQNLKEVFHGVSSEITILDPDEKLFENIPDRIHVGRYHSWVVDQHLPESLIATSVDHDQNVMSLRHTVYNVKGVQFHPESILTPFGKQILKNWIS